MRVTGSREDGVYIDDKGEKAPLVASPHAVAKVFIQISKLDLPNRFFRLLSNCLS